MKLITRLLGLNGAGKTTLMKMMIGELTASSGRVFINGYDLRQNYSKARQNLGYCPQFDYLPEYLSVRETLVLFAQLKGIPTIQMSAAIADLIRVFMLHELRDKLVKNLR
jgi:ATP-binding cassette subfamily A (ABC1) protein 3